MPDHRVWTLIARHPLHTHGNQRDEMRHAELEIDEPRRFLPHLIAMAQQVAPAHTTDHPDTWIREWELEVYREPDDLEPHRRFRFDHAHGVAA